VRFALATLNLNTTPVGGWGESPGDFAGPTALVASVGGLLAVCDHGNNRVQIFKDFQVLHVINLDSSPRGACFLSETSICIALKSSLKVFSFADSDISDETLDCFDFDDCRGVARTNSGILVTDGSAELIKHLPIQ